MPTGIPLLRFHSPKIRALFAVDGYSEPVEHRADRIGDGEKGTAREQQADGLALVCLVPPLPFNDDERSGVAPPPLKVPGEMMIWSSNTAVPVL